MLALRRALLARWRALLCHMLALWRALLRHMLRTLACTAAPYAGT